MGRGGSLLPPPAQLPALQATRQLGEGAPPFPPEPNPLEGKGAWGRGQWLLWAWTSPQHPPAPPPLTAQLHPDNLPCPSPSPPTDASFGGLRGGGRAQSSWGQREPRPPQNPHWLSPPKDEMHSQRQGGGGEPGGGKGGEGGSVSGLPPTPTPPHPKASTQQGGNAGEGEKRHNEWGGGGAGACPPLWSSGLPPPPPLLF